MSNTSTYDTLSSFLYTLIGQHVTEITPNTIIVNDGTRYHIRPIKGCFYSGEGTSSVILPVLHFDKPATITDILLETTLSHGVWDWEEKVYLVLNNTPTHEPMTFKQAYGLDCLESGIRVSAHNTDKD